MFMSLIKIMMNVLRTRTILMLMGNVERMRPVTTQMAASTADVLTVTDHQGMKHLQHVKVSHLVY